MKNKKPSKAMFRLTVKAKTETGENATRKQIKDASYSQNIDLGNCENVVFSKIKTISRSFDGASAVIVYEITARAEANDVGREMGIECVECAIQEMMMWWGGDGWDKSPSMNIELIHIINE
jgi:hypothetical protein